VKMTEDWRRALDNNLVVGVVFVDFRFDLSPNLAEETSRARCIGQSLVVDKELSLESPSSDCDQWSCIEVNAC
jgi:hypothetical protein